MLFCASNETSSSIFDRLWRVEGDLADTQKMCFTVVKLLVNKSVYDSWKATDRNDLILEMILN